LRRTMSAFVGVERDETELREALSMIRSIERASRGNPSALNMLTAAKLVTSAALLRRESVGAHFRRDYPQRPENPERSFLTLRQAETAVAEVAESHAGERERRFQ